jgi:SAM-dependent methyltransferase
MPLSAEQIAEQKEQTKKQWNANPCGQVGDVSYSPEYFQEVERFRYDEYGTWMRDFYRYDDHKDVKLLEIGVGQGTDLAQYCKGGAECYGVDITKGHWELALANFSSRGYKAEIFLEDAADLHFENNSFDKVVSFGVLHHTPDIEQCVAQVHRVLKPGGKFVISLYHRNSFFWFTTKLIKEGILKGHLFKIGYAGLKSTIETGADGKNIKPYVKLYTRKSMTKLLEDFSTTEIHVRHLYAKNIWPFGKWLPKSLIKRLEPLFGWYIIGVATK